MAYCSVFTAQKLRTVTTERVPITRPWSPRFGLVVVAASLAAELFIVAVNLVFLLHGRIGAVAFSVLPTLLIVDLTLVGGLLAVRRPDNAIGWLLLAAGFLAAVAFACGYYTDLDDLLGRSRLPFVVPVAWIGSWTFVPGIALLVAFLPVLFPSGHLPGPRWRIFVGVVIFGLTAGTLTTALAPGPLQSGGVGWIVNPVVLPAPLSGWLQTLGTVSNLLLLPTVLIAMVGLIARFRRSRGVERQQMKWFLFVAAIAGAALGFSVAFSGPVSDAAWMVGLLAIALLPIAIGLAILRYRLYDIDVLVNRTVVYGIVTAILVVTLGLGNLALQRLFEAVGGQQLNLFAGFLGGVFVAATFTPLRRRVRPLVDQVLPRRALLTLLFTDIVGSTKTVVELGDERWRGLLDRYLSTVRGELSRHRGHEVNTAGDAFFATFERPADGLACARAIRSAVRDLGLETRTGLHRGECEMRGEQPSGLAVHTAARVMAAAGEGEILVSDAMREALQETDLALVDRGRHELRGVPGEWQLYAAEPGRASG